MEVVLVKLDDLRQQQRSRDRSAFQREHPGAFLLAMGFLSAEVIRARHTPQPVTIEAQGKKRGDQTTALSFGSRLRHDALASHPLAGLAFFLRPATGGNHVTVGRGVHCDLTVPDRSVSDEHCRIEVTERGVVAVDLGSTNGTSVNLARLEAQQPTLLGDEDVITLGRYSFQLLTADTMYSELQLLNELEQT